MKIADIVLPHGLLLGPMAGYSDRAMRLLCREFGAEMTVSEMVSAKAVCYGDKKTAQLARIGQDELPCALQLFGSEPQTMAQAACRMAEGIPGFAKPSAIDINMGCPMKKIISGGDGGALMKDPHLIERIVRAVTDAVDLPVTVKIRAGWDENTRNAPDCARAAEEGGAAAITVHGRTVRQVYTGQADWSIIRAVKQAVSLPVIGNGDVTCAAEAQALLRETGCDGVMVARAAVGNPFLFAEISAALEGRPYTPPTPAEVTKVALRQLRLACEDKGERLAMPEARKQIAAYLHGRRGAADLRRRINAAVTYAEAEAILLEAEAMDPPATNDTP